MKVSELIEALEDLDPDANVYIMMQENWPFECDIRSVVVREDMHDNDEDDVNEKDICDNDVFIVEGGQLRYGSKAAWSF